jgi:hypothetical protein
MVIFFTSRIEDLRFPAPVGMRCNGFQGKTRDALLVQRVFFLMMAEKIITIDVSISQKVKGKSNEKRNGSDGWEYRSSVYRPCKQ